MILKVAHLKEGVVEHVASTYDAAVLDIEFVDFHYLQKIALDGLAERIKHTVTLQGTLSSRIEQICARCLEHIESDTLAPFNLSYDVQGKETIDATDDLRDILILGHPDRFLCQENCTGICPGCGINMNREACRCQSIPSREKWKSSTLGDMI